MKSLNLLFASIISSAGILATSPSAYAGYSCSTLYDTTTCSGTINGVNVRSSSSTLYGTTTTTGTIGGQSFRQTCSTLYGTTYCN